jgi:hypothetical protein
MSQSQYTPEKGTEEYIHVEVTAKNGQTLAKPVVEQYHPNVWPGVSKLAGFKGEVVYDPRSATEKTQDAPPASTVKAAQPLETLEQFRERYKTLFHEEAPFNIAFDDLKKIVADADKKLPEAPADGKVASEEEQSEQGDKLPTNKEGWFKLFQAQFPEDQTTYDDITVAQIREKLAK